MENKINSVIPAEILAEVKTHFDQAREKLSPYLIALTPRERIELPKMGDGNLPFVQKGVDFCESKPEFAPPFIDVTGFENDMEFREALLSIFYPLHQLHQDLDDTILQAGSECYVAALAYYNSVKQAAKLSIPGAKAIYEEMKVRFADNGKSATATTEA